MNEPQNIEGIFAAVEDPIAPPLKTWLFQPDEALKQLPEFAEIIDLWLERRGSESLPDWVDMDFADFRGWHAHLMLSKFETEDPDPTFRVVGEEVTVLLQFPTQNRRISDLAPTFYELQFREHFRRIRDEGLFGLTSGELPAKGRGHAVLRILEIPFRDGGTRVERLLHVLSRAAE